MRCLLLCLLFCLSVTVSHGQLALANVDGVVPVEQTSIDFLYINANAGEAAGGHTALRLGDSVFHYQFFPNSTFLLVREPWESFRFLYNELHNRTIAMASLALPVNVAVTIREHFTEILARQDQFFSSQQDLDTEQAFFKDLLAGKSRMEVANLGFFKREGGEGDENSLYRAVEYHLGSGQLVKAMALAEIELQTTLGPLGLGELSVRELRELLSLSQALRVLIEGRVLVANALIPALETELELTMSEQTVLQSFAGSQVTAIAKLLQSQRPDRGEVILLHAARYYAIRSSLAGGRLLSLDPFFEGVRRVDLSSDEVLGPLVRGLQRDLLVQVKQRRALFFTENRHPEIAYSLLETSRAKAWELLRVGPLRHEVRILNRVTLPSRPELVALPQFSINRQLVENRLRELQDNVVRLRGVQEENYGYNLFNRNCATELIRSLNGSFLTPEKGRAALGGWMEPDAGLVFIPFLFYQEALTAYELEREEILQGRRLRNLEALYESENDLVVWLRESNILSSTLYQSRSKDSSFLFFTDDTWLLRPVLGLVNVAYGAGNSLFGAFSSPFDGGTRLQQSLRGIFYSLPELVFGNIRKGSYAVGEVAGDDGAILGNGPTSL